MSQSLIAFDTNHIKSYVFGTNRLKEIRGASSILDKLNRDLTVKEANKFKATKIYAHGGSALFVIDSDRAEQLGQAVQKLYHENTNGGASITYAIQPILYDGQRDIMDVEDVSRDVKMVDVRKLLSLRLRLAKDNLHMDIQQDGALTYIAEPSHAFLCTCESCGVAYAQNFWKDPDDKDDDEGRYCGVCLGKRLEDRNIKSTLHTFNIQHSIQAASENATLWGRIQGSLGKDYLASATSSPSRPNDFNVFRNFTHGKEYLGLIYADVNNMGKALQDLPTLRELEDFATKIDKAVFAAIGHAIKTHLPLVNNTFPFDILLIGGDDIVIIAPADKAMQIAQTLGEMFYSITNKSLSIGVVLAPIKYPFRLQYMLVDETIKAAKKDGAQSVNSTTLVADTSDQTRINFLVVTGNTSLSYQNRYNEMHRDKSSASSNEFYATLRPYTLSDFAWLLQQLQTGNQKRLGHTKLHQLSEAILKLNQTTTIVDALALLRNWNDDERIFIKQMVQRFDTRLTQRQKDMGPLFPWYLDGKESNNALHVYRTPLLDFIELYDFVLP